MNYFVNEEIKEAMASMGLDMNDKKDCKKYAEQLEAGKVKYIPSCLIDLITSRNGKCEWYKWKDFVNYYKHGINFSMVSRFFEDPIPLGYEVIYEEWDANSTELEREDGSVDSRDKMVVKIDPNHYVIVKVDPQYTKSGKVRIITAFMADKSVVQEAEKKRAESGSTELFQSLVNISDIDYSYLGDIAPYTGDLTKFAGVYSCFKATIFNKFETSNRLLEIDPSLSASQADAIVMDWLQNKNIEFLLKHI